MVLVLLLILSCQLLFAAGTELRRWANDSGLVSVENGHFQLNGSPYVFYGTNAYWIHMLSDTDMDTVFHDIATAGLSVVRTWAFNDVSEKPSSGTYFQILKNGNATINTGADGLQRLDQLVATAKKYDIKLVLSLTNNWGSDAPQASTSFRRNNDDSLPRAFLSNDYGGIDLYNKAYESNPTHDDFYTKSEIISAFKNYISQVVPRYLNDSTILGWELGNDVRCSSTLKASSSCNTTTITKWVNEISGYIKTLDPDHLITAGDGGFYCKDCKKLYANSSALVNSPGGPTFDGSYGVDTEDILSVPCVDFGSFQIFPDQVEYYPQHSNPTFAVHAISQGSRWVNQHSSTATSFKKPVALTAFAIVTKDNWPLFVPFNSSARMPAGAPCGGVDDFQKDYAFVSWSQLALNGNVGGMLEYQWLQKGLSGVPKVSRKRQNQGNGSPNDGNGNYQDGQTGQTAQQVLAQTGGP